MEWITTPGLSTYPDALARMAARVEAIQQGKEGELGWLVEHPPLYTLGTSAKASDVLGGAIPSYETGRGGQVTYHGPGQRVVYLMMDLNKRCKDLRAYVKQLESWIILTLGEFGIDSFTRDGRIGVWVNTAKGEAKIAALGVRVQKWVTSHGIAINVHPDLSHYAGIIPCGIREFGVTSMKALGHDSGLEAVDSALRKTFAEIF